MSHVLKPYLAINILGQGFIVQNARCVEYTPKVEDASLFSSEQLAHQVIDAYDYKVGEFVLEPVNVLVLHGAKEEAKQRLFLTLSADGHKTEVFAVLLNGSIKDAAGAAHNAASLLRILFAGESNG